MKKIIIIAAVLFTASSSFAQGFAIGAKGGVNVTKISGSSFNEKFETGYHAGGFMQIKLSKKLTLQPEVLFSQVNTKVDSSFDALYSNLLNLNYVKTINLKYLTVPVVLNYNLGKAVALQSGVQYAKLIDDNRNLLQNGENAFKSGDFSVLAGVQFKLGKLMLSGRYLIGLNSINDIDNRDSWKNQTAQVSVGFRL